MTFLAEADTSDSDTVRLRYVIDDSVELVIPREWWEQLGSPDEVELTIEASASAAQT